MNEKGITNAAALVGGTQAWEKAGYPMESNPGSANQNKNADNANKQNNAPKKDTKENVN